jgi:hypothetical protein
MAAAAWNFRQDDTSRAAVCPCASFSACEGLYLILDAILASIFAIFPILQQAQTA